jgi:hypothetical protein
MLIALAAVIAASLAAAVAVRNHREQLQHDRELRAREQVGQLLDKAFDSAAIVIEASVKLRNLVEMFLETQESLNVVLADPQVDEERRAAADDRLKKRRDELEEARQSLIDRTVQARWNSMRMQLRLDSPEIVLPYREFLKAVADRRGGLEEAMEVGEWSSERAEGDDAYAEAGRNALTDFSAGCMHWFSEADS